MPDTLLDLGQRIREERQARQWTLEQFSEKTGLSKSFLSQIERGNTEPSITSLKKNRCSVRLQCRQFISQRTGC